MALIPFPAPEILADDVTASLDKYGSLNVTRMMAHQPALMQAYGRMGVELLRRGRLDPVLRELLILRVGQLCNSDYELHQHVSVARAVGMPASLLESVLAGDWSALDEPTLAALAIVEEVCRETCASADVMTAAMKYFDHGELVEILILAGYYVMTAGFLSSLEIEVEDGPPLGETMRG